MSTPTDSQGTPAPTLGQALTIASTSMQVRTAPGPSGALVVVVVVGNPMAAAVLPLDDESVGMLIASLTSCRDELRAATGGLSAVERPQLVVPNMPSGTPKKLHRP